MIIILIKDQKGRIYQTSSFNDKLEKEIKSNPEDKKLLLKHLSKEFNVLPDSIHKYWIANEE
jgi:hypothetical protein